MRWRNSLSADQQRVVLALWLTYALFYLGRLNISPALAPIAASLDVTLVEVGILGTAFFWAYAIGQFISGYLGDYLRPRWIIACGLLVISVCNLLFAAQPSLPVMIALWAVNGLAQASGWGPMLRIISDRLDRSQQKRVSVIFSMSYQIGIAMSWLLSSLLIVAGDWRLAFLVPGVVLLVLGFLWMLTGADAEMSLESRPAFRWHSLITDARLWWPVLVAAVFNGIIYNGVLIWLPTYFIEMEALPPLITASLTAIMPLMGALGMGLAGIVLERTGDPIVALRIFFAAVIIASIASVISTPPLQILLVSANIFALGGAAALLMGSIPVMLAPAGRTSSAAGTITATQNLGGGLSAVLTGAIIVQAGWNGVFLLWVICAVAASLAVTASRQRYSPKSL